MSEKVKQNIQCYYFLCLKIIKFCLIQLRELDFIQTLNLCASLFVFVVSPYSSNGLNDGIIAICYLRESVFPFNC